MPDFSYEQRLWNLKNDIVIGIDEVGRGAFAGPLVAAGVAFAKTSQIPKGITDSKLLSARIREQLHIQIKQTAQWYFIAEIAIPRINTHGIGSAVFEAFGQIMAQASKKFGEKHIGFLIDGHLPQTFLQTTKSTCQGIIKGDQKSLSIAAASIIAKVYRDRLMTHYNTTYPQYLFGQNKGYGTEEHRKAIGQYGFCELHRKSFDLEKYTNPLV